MIPCKEGASCPSCPLYEVGIPVADRPAASGVKLALVGEMPGKDEVVESLCFVGQTGQMVEAAIRQLGSPQPYMTNAVRCGLPRGAKPSPSQMQAAADICVGDVVANLREGGFSVVMALGGFPWEQLSGFKGIEKYRGCVMDDPLGEPWKLTCSIHPAAILRQEMYYPWVELLVADLGKAFKLASGELDVWKPTVLDGCDYDAVQRFLRALRGPVACDVETDGLDALSCNLKTVGLANQGVAVSIPVGTYYDDLWKTGEWNRVAALLRQMCDDPNIPMVFHNKVYDVPVMERYFGPIRGERHDTLLEHHACFPKLPHTLQQVTTQFLAAEPWKVLFDESMGKKKWTEKETGDELAQLLWYNASDTGATEYLHHRLKPEIASHGVREVVDGDRKLVDIAIDWHQVGIAVDRERAAQLEEEYRLQIDEMWDALQSTVAEETKDPDRLGLKGFMETDHKRLLKGHGFNPRSPDQLANFLFTILGLRPRKLTATGKRSTAKDALFELRDEHPFIRDLLEYREIAKLWSTYLKNLESQLGEDGRLHAVYKLAATPSGRFGTSPNVQNWPYSMREMLVAPPGRKLIGADYAALELRLSALLAGQEDLIEAFNADVDIHARHAGWFFGETWQKLEDELARTDLTDEERKRLLAARKALRGRGKNVTFGKIYRAGAKTLFEQIREKLPGEDQDRLMREVTFMSATLDAKYPQIVAAADHYWESACRDFCLRTFLSGRLRKYPMAKRFPPPPTETANHPIQGGAADIINMATLRWVWELEDEGLYHDGVWPILQIHDALYAEVDEDIAQQEAERLERCMFTELEHVSPITGRTNRLRFPAEASVGDRISEV